MIVKNEAEKAYQKALENRREFYKIYGVKIDYGDISKIGNSNGKTAQQIYRDLLVLEKTALARYQQTLRKNPRRRPKVWSRKALGLPARIGYADDPDVVDFITGKTPVEMGIKMKKARAPRAAGTKPKVARFYRDPDTIDLFAGSPRKNPRRRTNPPRPVGWGTGTKYRFSGFGAGNDGQVRLYCTSLLPSEYMPPPWVYATAVGLMVGTSSRSKAESLAAWFLSQKEWAWAQAMKTRKGSWYAVARAWGDMNQAMANVVPF